MQSLFEYTDYKRYVRDRVQSMPKGGRGEFRKIALTLRMHTTLISQIFGGAKDLTLEQASELCAYLGLTELEAEYLLSLVEFARAGNTALQALVQKRLTRLRTRAQELGDRLPQDKQLSEVEQAIFYSSWDYSAIRLLTSIPQMGNAENIARSLDLPRERVIEVLEFLLQHGLVTRDGNGKLSIGPARTHVRSDSPFVLSHHRNWRLNAIAHQGDAGRAEVNSKPLHFTAPMTLSGNDFEEIRKVLLTVIENISQRAAASDSEHLAALTIDWLRVT